MMAFGDGVRDGGRSAGRGSGLVGGRVEAPLVGGPLRGGGGRVVACRLRCRWAGSLTGGGLGGGG